MHLLKYLNHFLLLHFNAISVEVIVHRVYLSVHISVFDAFDFRPMSANVLLVVCSGRKWAIQRFCVHVKLFTTLLFHTLNVLKI